MSLSLHNYLLSYIVVKERNPFGHWFQMSNVLQNVLPGSSLLNLLFFVTQCNFLVLVFIEQWDFSFSVIDYDSLNLWMLFCTSENGDIKRLQLFDIILYLDHFVEPLAKSLEAFTLRMMTTPSPALLESICFIRRAFFCFQESFKLEMTIQIISFNGRQSWNLGKWNDSCKATQVRE